MILFGNRGLRSGLLAAAALAAVGTAGPVHAQMDTREGIALQNQILELRRDFQALRDQVARGGGGAAGGSFLGGAGRPVPLTPSGPPAAASVGGGELTAQLVARVNALEEQMRSLQGRIDELGNRVQNQGQDLPKQIGDLNFRLQQLESGQGRSGGSPPPVPGGGVAPAASNAAAPPAAVSGTPPPRRPELALQEGNAALGRRDYATAEATAREVLQNNRTSPRAYDAQFLLAESLAGRQNWAQAAIAYDDTYSRSRTGSRAQDSLVGLANSLIGLGDKRAGCAALVKLRTEFPALRADLRDQVAATSKRGGC